MQSASGSTMRAVLDRPVLPTELDQLLKQPAESHTCARCHDTGWLRKFVGPQPWQTDLVRCVCQREADERRRAEKARSISDLDKLHAGCTFANYDRSRHASCEEAAVCAEQWARGVLAIQKHSRSASCEKSVTSSTISKRKASCPYLFQAFWSQPQWCRLLRRYHRWSCQRRVMLTDLPMYLRPDAVWVIA